MNGIIFDQEYQIIQSVTQSSSQRHIETSFFISVQESDPKDLKHHFIIFIYLEKCGSGL